MGSICFRIDSNDGHFWWRKCTGVVYKNRINHRNHQYVRRNGSVDNSYHILVKKLYMASVGNIFYMCSIYMLPHACGQGLAYSEDSDAHLIKIWFSSKQITFSFRITAALLLRRHSSFQYAKHFQENCALLDITQRRVLILYWRFGITYRSHLQGSRSPSKQNRADRLSRNVRNGLPFDAA
jgi:hypothetical protein